MLFPFVLPTDGCCGCWGRPCSCREEQADPGAVASCLIPAPGNFTGVKGEGKHCEGSKPRAGVDCLSGLEISDQRLVGSRWAFAGCCCEVCGGYSGWRWVKPSISVAPLPPCSTRQPLQVLPGPFLPWAGRIRDGIEGELGYGPLPPSPLSHRVPGECGCRVGAASSPFLCIQSTVLISEDLPAFHLGGKETPACLSLHITRVHIFPPLSLAFPFFFPSSQKKKPPQQTQNPPKKNKITP